MLMKKRFNKFLTLLAVLLLGFGQMWGADVITFKGATTKDSKSTALTPTISSSNENITTGTCASTCSAEGYLISTTDGKTVVLGSTTYYLAQPYQSGSKKYWKDAGANFYGTFTIPSGYKYTIKGVNHALAAVSSSNFTATITVKDATTTKYTSASLSIASKSSGATITSTAINLEEANWVVLAAGTYTINVTPSNTSDASTGKYFGIAEVALTGDLESAAPATNYTVTIDPNGGSYASTPDGWTYSAGVYTKEIASGTSFSAPAGLSKGTDDLSWKDGEDNVVTFPVTISDDITFVAQWAPHAASSDATLSALSVAGLTLNETFDPATTAYTANLPFYGVMPIASAVTATKNDPNAEDPEVSISSNVITIHCEAEDGTTKDYTITVAISPTPTASSSINIEQNVLDNTKSWDVAAALAAANIVVDGTNGLDSLNDAAGKTARNYGFLGLKFNKAKDIIKVVVPASNVLNVKFGNIATAINVTINGVVQTPIATRTDGVSTVYHLDADAKVREVIFNLAVASKTVTLQQVKIGAGVDEITLPWLVTYNAGEHGTCATAKEVWTGTALTLPAVTPESGWDFDGWFDGETQVTSPYNPGKNAALEAHYTAQASPFDLTALTYKIGTGAAQNVGYVDGTFTYNIELPYAHSYDAITVTPTLKEATSYLKGDEVLTVTSLPGAATFTVVENGGASEQLYTVNFTKAPKEPICLIWGNVANNSLTRDATKSQLNGTLANSNVRDDAVTLDDLVGPKFQSNGYLSIALEGQDIKAGDQVKIFVTSLNGLADKLRVFNANEAIDANVVAISAENMTTRVNTVTMTENASTIYLRRGNDYSSWNPCVAYVAVYRAMNPVLTAITFDGVDADQDSEFAFSATLPQGTNLGTMTVTPTIVWNGAGSAAPTAAWAWGDNTYRVTDKDGDYTDYTITLTEALAPSAAPTITTQPADANYYEGATIDALEVVATGSGDLTYQWFLGSDPIDGATSATYTPTVTAIGSYVYHCVVTNTEAGHPATSLASDEATITISEDPAAIKLLDGSTVNHTNFITGVTASTVEIESVEHNCVTFSGTVSDVNGVKDLTRVIAYNATTTQTKIQLKLYNSNGNSRTILVKGLVEGATETTDLATITLNGNELNTTDWIEFNNIANRTIYIFVSSNAGHIKILQTKVIESGTDLKMAGEAGYSLNFNKGRFFGVKEVTAHFEEMDVEVESSDCQPLNTSVVKLASSSMSFDVVAPVTLTVTTNNSNTYYVTKGAAGTDNETAKTGASDFDLTAGTWYITAGSSNVEITNIAFAAPKCAEPEFNALANSDICEGDAYVALNGTATVSDAGVPTYQWYNADGNVEIDGATGATYTPTADGSYYVIATNHLTGYSDNAKQSATVTVTTFASAVITTAPLNKRGEVDDVVTLTVAASGKNVAYKWYTCDEDGSNEEAIVPEQTGTSLDVTITAGMAQWYKVKVTSDCGGAEAKAKVTEFQPTAPANVTGSILWDWKSTAAGFPTTSGTKMEFTNTTDEELFADVDAAMPNNEYFRSDMLYGVGQYAWRNTNDSEWGFQGFQIKFHTTVAGLVRIYYRAPSSGNVCSVTIDAKSAGSRTNSWGWSEYVEVEANKDIVISMVNSAGADKMTRVQKIEFLEKIDSRTGYAANDLGTACYEYDAVVIGATAYMIAGINESGYIVFDEVTENRLEAGKPYLFEADGGKIFFCKPIGVTAAPLANGEEITIKGMVGTFTGTTLTQGADDLCYFSGRHLWRVNDFTVGVTIPEHRCYVNYDVLKSEGHASAPAAGRRRISMGVNGKDAAQGFENILGGDQPMKVMIDGTLYIIRGEKVFDATGRLVK